jgi:hypothetical protein
MGVAAVPQSRSRADHFVASPTVGSACTGGTVPVVTERVVTTPVGDARLIVDRARMERGTLALGHGAGGGIGARDLAALASALPSEGITVVRVEQPYSVAHATVRWLSGVAAPVRGWRAGRHPSSVPSPSSPWPFPCTRPADRSGLGSPS